MAAFMKKRKKEQSSFTTRQGIILSIVLGLFFALVFLLVGLYWDPTQ